MTTQTQNIFKSSNICGVFTNSDYPDGSILANGTFNRDLHIKGDIYIGDETKFNGFNVDTGGYIYFTLAGVVYTVTPAILQTLITLSSQSLATQSYVTTQLAALIASAPSTLDTLNELATALGNDPNFATTVTTNISTKASLTANNTMTGTTTFSTIPSCTVTPSTGYHMTNKNYTDGTFATLANNCDNTTTQIISGAKSFSNASNSFTGSGAGLTGIVASSLPSNVMYTNNVQTITATKTFNNSTIIMDDGTGYNTTIKQNSINSAFELNQNYNNGYINFNTKTASGVVKAGSYSSSGGFSSSLHTITDTAGGMDLSRMTYTSPNLSLTNTALSGNIIFHTSDALVDSTPFTINSTNCSFTQPPICSVAPTTSNMLVNKNYVDTNILVNKNYVDTKFNPLTLTSGTNTSTITEVVTVLNFTNNNNTGSFNFYAKDTVGSVYQPLIIAAQQTKIQTNLSISDPTATYTTNINNVLQSTNINNSNVNLGIGSFYGLIPSVNLSVIARTDGGGALPNGIIYNSALGYNSNLTLTTSTVTYLSSFTNILRINVPTGLNPLLNVGAYITTGIGTIFLAGTYIVSSAGAGQYVLNQSMINSFSPMNITFATSKLSIPFYTSQPSSYFYLDYGSNINLQLTNSSGVQTTMLSCAQSGVSLNGSVIGMSVPPTMQYINLPTILSNQIGYNALINGNNPSTLTTIGTGTFTSLINGGLILVAGVYVITFKTYMTQLGATAGYINYNAVGLSTITTGFSGGCNCFCSGMMYFPDSCPWPYILNTSTMILNVSTPTLYYYLLNVNYGGITIQMIGNLNSISYVKIA